MRRLAPRWKRGGPELGNSPSVPTPKRAWPIPFGRTAEGHPRRRSRIVYEERELLTKAILASDLDDVRRAAGQALLVSQKRKEGFFVGDKDGGPHLEDIFLAMEGLAMWVQYPDGAGAGAVGRGLAEDVQRALGET